MANAVGGLQVVNHTPTMISHISIVDDDNAMLEAGQIVTAAGSDGSLYRKGIMVDASNDGKRGVARITCTQGPSIRHRDFPPDGTLTVTITGGPDIDDLDVTYVDDTD